MESLQGNRLVITECKQGNVSINTAPDKPPTLLNKHDLAKAEVGWRSCLVSSHTKSQNPGHRDVLPMGVVWGVWGGCNLNPRAPELQKHLG